MSLDRRPTVPDRRVGPGDGDAPRGVWERSLVSWERRLGVVVLVVGAVVVVTSGAGGDGALLCDNGVNGGTGGKRPGVDGTDESGEVNG